MITHERITREKTMRKQRREQKTLRDAAAAAELQELRDKDAKVEAERARLKVVEVNLYASNTVVILLIVIIISMLVTLA